MTKQFTNNLIEKLQTRVADWRARHYHIADYSTITELVEWAADPDAEGFRLRPPQLRALETYWYLRLVEHTPKMIDLYAQYFPPEDDPDAFLNRRIEQHAAASP